MSKKGSKNKKKTLIKWIICIVIIVLAVLIFGIFNNNDNSKFPIKKDEKLGQNIYTTYIEFSDMYNIKNQDEIENKIQYLKINKSVENPLIIYNAYGLNPYSCNVYFKTKDNVKVSYKVETEGNSYSNELYNENEYSKKHEYQIIGLVPGCCNYITLITEDEKQEKKEYTFEINVPDVEFPKPETSILENTEQNISEGLFVYLDLRHKKEYSNIYNKF